MSLQQLQKQKKLHLKGKILQKKKKKKKKNNNNNKYNKIDKTDYAYDNRSPYNTTCCNNKKKDITHTQNSNNYNIHKNNPQSRNKYI
jgi:hypothetical protein